MRTTLTALALILSLSLLFSFNTPTDRLANVDQVQGIYLFYHSKPVDDFEYMGTYKIGMTISGQPDELFNKMLKKVKNQYPDAQAIIIAEDMSKCDVIKFK